MLQAWSELPSAVLGKCVFIKLYLVLSLALFYKTHFSKSEVELMRGKRMNFLDLRE